MESAMMNATESPLMPDYGKGITLFVFWIVSLLGNTTTVIFLLKFKKSRIPDTLVIALACTDLVASIIPVPMAMYYYFSGYQLSKGTPECNFFGTIAQWTRYTAAILVTLISIDRYMSVVHPVVYSIKARIWHAVLAIAIVLVIATTLAIVPWLSPSTPIVPSDQYCLFSFVTPYAMVIVAYGAIQFVIVMFCFAVATVALCRVYARRRKMKRQGERNWNSARRSNQGPLFIKPGLSAKLDTFKKAAPVVSETLKLSIEAQFARMLLAITLLFYASWLPIVVLIIYAYAIGDEDGGTFKEILFWCIRFTVISTAVNPILYGLLCRQYRQLYIYLLRRIFSYCCSCIHKPYYSPFQYRDHPPQHIEAKMQRAKESRKPMEKIKFHGSYRSLQSLQSQTSSQNSHPITRATTNTNVSLHGLFGIEEELSSFDTSIFYQNDGNIKSEDLFRSEYLQNRNFGKKIVSLEQFSGDGIDDEIADFISPTEVLIHDNKAVTRFNPLHGLEEDQLLPNEYFEQGQYGQTIANPAFQKKPRFNSSSSSKQGRELEGDRYHMNINASDSDSDFDIAQLPLKQKILQFEGRACKDQLGHFSDESDAITSEKSSQTSKNEEDFETSPISLTKVAGDRLFNAEEKSELSQITLQESEDEQTDAEPSQVTLQESEDEQTDAEPSQVTLQESEDEQTDAEPSQVTLQESEGEQTDAEPSQVTLQESEDEQTEAEPSQVTLQESEDEQTDAEPSQVTLQESEDEQTEAEPSQVTLQESEDEQTDAEPSQVTLQESEDEQTEAEPSQVTLQESEGEQTDAEPSQVTLQESEDEQTEGQVEEDIRSSLESSQSTLNHSTKAKDEGESSVEYSAIDIDEVSINEPHSTPSISYSTEEDSEVEVVTKGSKQREVAEMHPQLRVDSDLIVVNNDRDHRFAATDSVNIRQDTLQQTWQHAASKKKNILEDTTLIHQFSELEKLLQEATSDLPNFDSYSETTLTSYI